MPCSPRHHHCSPSHAALVAGYRDERHRQEIAHESILTNKGEKELWKENGGTLITFKMWLKANSGSSKNCSATSDPTQENTKSHSLDMLHQKNWKNYDETNRNCHCWPFDCTGNYDSCANGERRPVRLLATDPLVQPLHGSIPAMASTGMDTGRQAGNLGAGRVLTVL